MLRQYLPQRFRNVETPRGTMPIGTMPIGTIINVRGACKIRVEAWLPRDYSTYERGTFTTKRIVGGHLALVQRLDNGKRFTLSDCWLLDAEEAS